MIDCPIPNGQLVTVMVAQTTFAVLATPQGQFRVDYLDKAEVRLKPGVRGEFSVVMEHPLLLLYNSPLVSTYINSKPQNPQQLATEIRKRIEAQLQGWREFSTVLRPQTLQQNLIDGNGILLQDAPVPIAQAVADACAEQGVLTWATPPYGGQQGEAAFKLLFVGKGYVIARDFRFTRVLTKTAPPPHQ